jgi:cobalt-zinc-cadmium efflux system protein
MMARDGTVPARHGSGDGVMGAGHGHRAPPAASAAGAYRSRLLAVFCIALVVFTAEVVGGLVAGSLALLADAGHMLSDVAGLGLTLLAVHFAARPASGSKTFGYYRVEILAAVGNAVLLLTVAVLIMVEAVRRLLAPPEVATGPMLVIAFAGMAANAVSLWLLRRGQAASLNLRGAYLEVLGDLLGSVAVVVAAAVISLTGWRQADPVASVAIGLLILPRTWSLLREAIDVLLEATPKGVDLAHVRAHILAVRGITDCHDLHAWTITSGMPVLSAHVVLAEGTDQGPVLDALGACLKGHFDIEHSTFQLEAPEHRDHEHATHP